MCQPGRHTRVSPAVSQRSHVFSVFVLFSYTNEASVPEEGTGGGGAQVRGRGGAGGREGGCRGNQGLLLLTELHLDGLYGALFVT